MTEVDKKSFRSKGRKINKSDDMYRVTIDLSKRDYHELLKPFLLAPQKTIHNNEYATTLKVLKQWQDSDAFVTTPFRAWLSKRVNSQK